MRKTLVAATLVALALSLSATMAEASSGRTVIPPSQQNYAGRPEAVDAIVPGAGREVIPPAQQNFQGRPETMHSVVPGAGREVIPPAEQHS